MTKSKDDIWGMLAAAMLAIAIGSGGVTIGYATGYAAAADKATPLLQKSTEMIIDCRRRLGYQIE